MSGHTYSTAQIDFLKLYADLPRKELTALFNKAFDLNINQDALAQVCLRRGILTGRTGAFEKGIIPHNKGSKQATSPKCQNTQFKPGQLPKTTEQLGTIRKHKDGYLYKKISEIPKAGTSNNWRQVHHIVWEEHHGAIPEGHVVIFLDGNKDNCHISNLACITRKELAVFNRKLKNIDNQFIEQKRLMALALMLSSDKRKFQ